MDFKSLISQLDQLNEAEGKTVHKGTYGTSHGKEDVRDQYGHKIGKVNKDAETDKEAFALLREFGLPFKNLKK